MVSNSYRAGFGFLNTWSKYGWILKIYKGNSDYSNSNFELKTIYLNMKLIKLFVFYHFLTIYNNL